MINATNKIKRIDTAMHHILRCIFTQTFYVPFRLLLLTDANDATDQQEFTPPLTIKRNMTTRYNAKLRTTYKRIKQASIGDYTHTQNTHGNRGTSLTRRIAKTKKKTSQNKLQNRIKDSSVIKMNRNCESQQCTKSLSVQSNLMESKLIAEQNSRQHSTM